jgi:hypothetical protein
LYSVSQQEAPDDPEAFWLFVCFFTNQNEDELDACFRELGISVNMVPGISKGNDRPSYDLVVASPYT